MRSFSFRFWRLSFGLVLWISFAAHGAVGQTDSGASVRRLTPSSHDQVSLGSLNYVAMGDSISFGIGASSVPNTWVSLYRDFLAIDLSNTVTLSNRAIPGQTSAQFLNALTNDSGLRSEVQNAEIITFNIGGNDLLAARAAYKANVCGGVDGQDCLRTALAQFRTNWDAIVVEILALRPKSNVVLKTLDVYNPLVNLDENADTVPNDGGLTDLEAFKPYLDAANLHIRDSAAAHGIALSRVYLKFNTVTGTRDAVATGLIASDNVHPNDFGHSQIADEFSISTIPTNIGATLLGSVTDSNGNGVPRAVVVVRDIYGRQTSISTNGFGRFRMIGLLVGETYLVEARSKEFAFARAAIRLDQPLTAITVSEN
ncbi:MAG: GDSL-type esterase/lipase family protein [Pyrinomonadaceae bacterium]